MMDNALKLRLTLRAQAAGAASLACEGWSHSAARAVNRGGTVFSWMPTPCRMRPQ
jgi:hypothetical protein